jgi:hypothetical protein
MVPELRDRERGIGGQHQSRGGADWVETGSSWKKPPRLVTQTVVKKLLEEVITRFG